MLAASIFLGVLFPSLASLSGPLLFPTIFLLFFFAVLQVSFADAVTAAVRNKACVLILLWQLVLLPLLAALLLRPVLAGDWYVFTLVALCTSSITATTALAKIFSLNDAMALSVCILGTLIMPAPLYIMLTYFAGLEVTIDLTVYASRIVIFILVPFLLVWWFRKALSVFTSTMLVPHTPTIVLILLMIFGLSVMDGVRAMMNDAPMHLLLLVVQAFAISLVVQLLTYTGLLFLGVHDAKTACLLCAYRNMGIVAAITGSALGENFLIFLGVWQLPMYVLPWLLRRFYQAGQT